MNKRIAEDWAFEVEVVDGISKNCRLGLEQGDKFYFEYETPKNFCPRALIEIFTWCEVVRCGGDFTYRGSKEKYEIDIPCPCNCLHFRLHAMPINSDIEKKSHIEICSGSNP